MYAVTDVAQSGPVGSSERAQNIQDRLTALGISDREFAERSGVDRKALRRAANGEPARPSTYTAIETWLGRLEDEVGRGIPPLPEGASYLGDPQGRMVEVSIEGGDGERVVVKWPIEDVAGDPQAAADLIAAIRRDVARRQGRSESDNS